MRDTFSIMARTMSADNKQEWVHGGFAQKVFLALSTRPQERNYQHLADFLCKAVHGKVSRARREAHLVCLCYAWASYAASVCCQADLRKCALRFARVALSDYS